MKNYAVIAVNKATGDVEHVGIKSDPFNGTPFGGIDNTHDFYEYEFDSVINIRARELMENVEFRNNGVSLKSQADVNRFIGFKKKPV
mgnify:CR=1 FL=1